MSSKQPNSGNELAYIGGRRRLYVEALEELEKLIKGKKLKPGEKLPSVEALVGILGVSRTTVREALANLETQGLIIRKQGSGTYVSHSSGKGFMGGLERIEPFRKIANRAGVNSEVVFRDVSEITPDKELAEAIDVQKDSTVIKIEIVEAINATPTIYIIDYLKSSSGKATELSDWQDSVITYLVKKCDPPLTHTRTEIFAVGASKVVASKFNVSEGKPILYQVESYFSSSGDLLGMGFVYIQTDYFHFFVNRRVV